MEINKNTKWLRKAAYAPLTVAILAGALSSGMGIGSAATDATTTPTGTPQIGTAYNWSVNNHTGQPIYGTWNATMHSGNSSHVEATADHPWKPGDAPHATQYQDMERDTTWTGHICYNKRWWDYTLSDWGFGEGPFSTTIPDFSLEVDSQGTLFVYPVSDARHFHSAMNPESSACI
ncbi:hypothetical protein R3Q06_35760 [Rhodococcus erythropolis]|uniref:hypothetical protein n=1 Tax=Rhodococcus erythropolis TaxID=1833 RepID=UPI00294A84C5|nr:hypothetical protein [Rhodococcus erythropolis]MDV6278728.1 hypothetical protein [Rhodococcus erythropolis]